MVIGGEFQRIVLKARQEKLSKKPMRILLIVEKVNIKNQGWLLGKMCISIHILGLSSFLYDNISSSYNFFFSVTNLI